MDKIVSAFCWRDRILIITERGKIIEMNAYDDFGQLKATFRESMLEVPRELLR